MLLVPDVSQPTESAPAITGHLYSFRCLCFHDCCSISQGFSYAGSSKYRDFCCSLNQGYTFDSGLLLCGHLLLSFCYSDEHLFFFSLTCSSDFCQLPEFRFYSSVGLHARYERSYPKCRPGNHKKKSPISLPFAQCEQR